MRRLTETPHKLSDGVQHLVIDLFLRLAGVSKLPFGHEQGMVAAFDDVKKVRRFHFAPDAFEQIERAERIAGALHE
jgi:hypothetical protein